MTKLTKQIMRTCDNCKKECDEHFTTEIGNPACGGMVICNYCAAKALFNLFETGSIRLVIIKDMLNLV